MSDLTTATRELFIRTVVPEVFMQTPFYDDLYTSNKVTFNGGKYIERIVDTDEIDDLGQFYSINEALTDGAKDTLEKPRFQWKYSQLPVRYSGDWEVQNAHAGQEEQLVDLPQFLVKKAQRGMRLLLTKATFNNGSNTPILAANDSFESLVSALNHDTAYGGITRTIGAAGIADWFQSADPAGLVEAQSSSTQDTAAVMSINNIRKWINETDVAHYMDNPGQLRVLMCPTLYNKVRAEMESKLVYKPVGDTQKQGFNKMELDGHVLVSVPYLQTTATMRGWVFILNLERWELRLSTVRNFNMTPFVWQGQNSNGYDRYLARILVAGNLVCWKPNSSMWLQSVS